MPNLPQRMADFYRALDKEGAKALDQLDELYAPSVRFVDPMHDTTGRAELRLDFERMFEQFESVHFSEVTMIGDDHHFMGTWTMILRPKLGPTLTVHGASNFKVEGDRVVFQHDYWDLLGSAMNAIPVVGPMYDWIVRRLFG